ncbi:MAG: hypothetical protein MJ177_08145 [Clostridia bacterium]|nr:hypothetical protein [Clostridia bacterium]
MLTDSYLRRNFSTCLYKNRRLNLGEFDLSKDFTGECDGDKYPVLRSVGEYSESVKDGIYRFDSERSMAARFITPLYPYASYEMTVEDLRGECGFLFTRGEWDTGIMLGADETGLLYIKSINSIEYSICKTETKFKSGMRFSVTVRPGKADIYFDFGKNPVHAATFTVPFFKEAAKEDVFTKIYACLCFYNCAAVSGASVFMDSGISQADIRPVCYENGEVMTENGKIYLTASVRQHEGAYQGVFSWVPGTCVFELTGALFFDAGDGIWGNDVASDLIFNRKTGKWLIWMCAFSHGHVLARAELESDVRHGVSVIDVKLTEPLKDGDGDEVFGGKKGDEDPALIFDEHTNKWLLAVCRISDVNNSYCYHFFESDSPLDGFRFTGKGKPGCETGGSFVRRGGRLYFVCGNSFEKTSDYRVYDMEYFPFYRRLEFDLPDGGFRGWGSIMPVKRGTREKLYMLTFDRHRGSDYRWSYGNIYCFSD